MENKMVEPLEMLVKDVEPTKSSTETVKDVTPTKGGAFRPQDVDKTVSDNYGRFTLEEVAVLSRYVAWAPILEGNHDPKKQYIGNCEGACTTCAGKSCFSFCD